MTSAATFMLFFGGPPDAPPHSISPPAGLGAVTQAAIAAGPETITLGEGVSAPAGDAIIVAVHLGSAATNASIFDSQGNTYSATAVSGLQGLFRLFYCPNPVALGPGDTITVDWDNNARCLASAISVAGIAHTSPLDKTGTLTTGTGTSVASPVGTGTLTEAVELIIGVTITSATAGSWSGAEDTDFTPLAPVTIPSGNAEMNWAYRITASPVSVDYGPGPWANSRSYGANVWSFKAG